MLDAPKLRAEIALWADDLGLELSNLDGDMLIDRIRALQAVGPEPAVDYHGLLDDAAFWIEGALKCKEWNWSPDQFDAASDCLSSIRSALVATPPAEPVVEADFDNWWKASKYRQVIYADESQRQIALDAWRAALAAKEGRS